MNGVPLFLDRHLAVRAAAVGIMAAAIAWSMFGASPDARLADVVQSQTGPLPIARAAGPVPDPLFAPATPPPAVGEGFDIGGPPDMLGLAGRLPDDVEVLIRNEDGGTSTLRIGEAAMGWKLVSVAPNRAVFEKGDQQVIRTLQ